MPPPRAAAGVRDHTWRLTSVLSAVESMLKAGSYLMPVAPDGASEEEALVFESRLQLMYTLADIAGILRSHLEEPKPPTFKARLLTALRLVRASQLSVEMDLGGLKAAVVVETLKLGIRLLLLVLQQDRSLLIDPAASDGFTAADEFIGTRTGLRLPPMQTMQVVPTGSKLNFSLPYPEDCLMMLRPLVYLGACSLVSNGKRPDPRQLKDWGPWMVASGMDLLGVVMLRERLRRDNVKPGDPSEREYRRRVRLMVMGMLLRSPMFDTILRRPLDGLSKFWEKIPVLNRLNYVGYYLFLQRFYYGMGAGDS